MHTCLICSLASTQVHRIATMHMTYSTRMVFFSLLYLRHHPLSRVNGFPAYATNTPNRNNYVLRHARREVKLSLASSICRIPEYIRTGFPCSLRMSFLEQECSLLLFFHFHEIRQHQHMVDWHVACV